MVVVQYTSPETLHFGHSIELLASMVIGGAGSILGSLLGGAWYVLVPQITNIIDPNITAVLQGAILLVVLFVLPGGLVSLPRLWRRRRSSGQHESGPRSDSPAEASPATQPDTTQPHTTQPHTTQPHTTQSEPRERQDP
jgi:branched-chain amino acid transport system permease protein